MQHLLGKVNMYSYIGAAVGGLKMMIGLNEVRKPQEVYFSITATKTENTVLRFRGTTTLNDLNILLWRKKAWSVAEKSVTERAIASVNALAEGASGMGEVFGAVGEAIGSIGELTGGVLELGEKLGRL